MLYLVVEKNIYIWGTKKIGTKKNDVVERKKIFVKIKKRRRSYLEAHVLYLVVEHVDNKVQGVGGVLAAT